MKENDVTTTKTQWTLNKCKLAQNPGSPSRVCSAEQFSDPLSINSSRNQRPQLGLLSERTVPLSHLSSSPERKHRVLRSKSPKGCDHLKERTGFNASQKAGHSVCHLIYSLHSVNIYYAKDSAGCQAGSSDQDKHVMGTGMLRLLLWGHTGHEIPQAFFSETIL